jgi:C1A family cysteine protease
VTEVKDQGSCGSCWTFATAACAESWLIRDGQFGDDIDLAEQYLLQCTEYSDCGGGFIEYAMALTANTGIPR